jgi:type IV/VI secretion system ImpK/VasF family protein
MRTCAEVVVIVTEISKQSPTVSTNMADMHKLICSKFDSIVKQCRVSSLPDDAAPELIYPLVALVDETILNIPEYKFFWSERLLQLRYFGEASAGMKFFARLETRMKAKEPKIDVLELYFVGLALGLRGMHSGHDRRRCEKIFESLGIMLKNVRRKNKRGWGSVRMAGKGERTKWEGMMPAVYTCLTLIVIGCAAIVFFVSRANLLNFLNGSFN